MSTTIKQHKTDQTINITPHTINYGKSTDTSILSIIKATVIKDLTILKRYKANLIGAIFEIVIFTLMFGVFAYSATFRGTNLDSRGMFTFFISGLLLIFFTNTALFVPVNVVTTELYNGTLEYLYSNPSSRAAYFIGTIIADLIIRLIFFIPMYGFLIYYTGISVEETVWILVIIFLVLCVVAWLGVLVGLTAILWKQVGSLVGIIQILFQFVSGMFIPVTSLPTGVIYISYLLPFTYGIDLVRYFAFSGNWETLMPLYVETFILIGFVIIYGLLAIKMLTKVEKHAKNKGLHLL